MKGEVYASPDGWRFRVKGNNNEIMCTGEAYVRRIDAESALKQLFSGARFDVTVKDHHHNVVDHFVLPARPMAYAPEARQMPEKGWNPMPEDQWGQGDLGDDPDGDMAGYDGGYTERESEA